MDQSSDPISQAVDAAAQEASRRQQIVAQPMALEDYLDQRHHGAMQAIPKDDPLHTFGDTVESWIGNNLAFGQYLTNPALAATDYAEGRLAEGEIRGVSRFIQRQGAKIGFNTPIADSRELLLEEYNPLADPAFQNLPASVKWRILDSTDNTAATQAVMQLQQEEQYRETLEQAGFFETLAAGLVTLPLDVTFWAELLVTKGALSAAKASSLTTRIAATRLGAVGTGAVGGSLAAGIQQKAINELNDERLLLKTQEEKDAEVAGAFIMGGLLGGAVGFLSGGTQSQLSREMAGVEQLETLAKLDDEVLSKLPPGATDADYADALAKVVEERGSESLRAHWSARTPLLSRLSPDTRLRISNSTSARGFRKLFSSQIAGAADEGADSIIRSGLDATKVRNYAEIWRAVGSSRKVLAESGSKIKLADFNRLVGEVLSVGDEITDTMRGIPGNVFEALTDADVAAINKAARIHRSILDRVEELAKKTGALEKWEGRGALSPTDTGVATYITRMYDREFADLNKGKLRSLIERWAEREGLDFTSADLDAAVQNIANPPKTGGAGRVSPFQQRVLEMPDDFKADLGGELWRLSDFLIKDVEAVQSNLLHNVLPSLLLAERTQGTRAVKSLGMIQRAENVRRRLLTIDDTDAGAVQSAARDLNDLSFEVHDNAVLRALDGQRGEGIDAATRKQRMDDYRLLAQERKDLNAKIQRAVREVQKQELLDDAASLASARKKLADLEAERSALAESLGVYERDATRVVKQMAEVEDLDLLRHPPTVPLTSTQEEMLDFMEQLRDRVSAERKAEFSTAAGIERWVREINDEADLELAAAKSKAAKDRIISKRDRDVKDMTAMWKRYNNVSLLDGDATNLVANVVNGLADLNYMTSMGGMVLSAMPDAAIGVMQTGLTPYVQAISQKSRSFFDSALRDVPKGEVEELLHGLEVIASMVRHDVLSGVAEGTGRSRFDRGRNALRKKFSSATGIQLWNKSIKALAATQIQNKMIRTVLRQADGKRLSRSDKLFLRGVGISDENATRLAAQLRKHGVRDQMQFSKRPFEYAQVGEWDDLELANIYKDALFQGVENAVVTPGSGDLSRAFDNNHLTRMLLQFKAFFAASTQRITMSALERHDAQTASAIMLMVGMGHVVDRLHSWMRGDDYDYEDTTGVVVNAIDRSGVMGLAMEGNALLTGFSGGTHGLGPWAGSDQELRRFSSRGMADTFLGPTAGRVEGLAKLGGEVFQGDFTQEDATVLRRQLPGQNLLPLRILMDKIATPAIFGEEADPRFERNLGLRAAGR